MEPGFKHSEVFSFPAEVDYSSNGIVSKKVIKSASGNISLFAFDKGESLSEHTAPFDALIQVIDGTARITIGGHPFILKEGTSIIMPADVPHAVEAVERFKMVLTMIR